MTKLLCLFIFLAFVLASLASGELIKKSDEFYFNDAAGVLSYDTKAVIYENSQALQEATKAQIVVVTVQSTGSYRASDYAYRLFNDWGIGDKKLDNGFLLLLQIASNPDDGDYTLQRGAGTGAILTDSEADDLLYDCMEADFARGKYDSAVLKVYKALFERIRNYYNVNLSFADAEALKRTGKIEGSTQTETIGGTAPVQEPASPKEKSGGFSMFWIILIIIIVVAIIYARSRRRRRSATVVHTTPIIVSPVRPVSSPRPRVAPPHAAGYTHSARPAVNRTYRAAPSRPTSFTSTTRSTGSVGGNASSSRSSYSSTRSSASRTSYSSSRSSASTSSRPSFGKASGGGGRSIGGGASRRK